MCVCVCVCVCVAKKVRARPFTCRSRDRRLYVLFVETRGVYVYELIKIIRGVLAKYYNEQRGVVYIAVASFATS